MSRKFIALHDTAGDRLGPMLVPVDLIELVQENKNTGRAKAKSHVIVTDARGEGRRAFYHVLETVEDIAVMLGVIEAAEQ